MLKIVLSLILAISFPLKIASSAQTTIDPNCLKWITIQNEDICTQCAPGYFQSVSQGCMECSKKFKGCLECSSDKCTSCQPDYTLHQNGFCYDQNCEYPFNFGCSRCKAGFTYFDGECVPGTCSQANCVQCGKDGCDICNDGYGPAANGTCQPGACSEYHPQCTKCSKAQGCLMCKGGYFPNGARDCGTCSSKYKSIGCATCNKSICLTCKNGFEMRDVPKNGKTCIMRNCDIFDRSDCLACQSQYSYKDQQCLIGQCDDENCARCGNKGCYECSSGYILKAGQCQRGTCAELDARCISCNVNGCTACIEGYYRDLSGACVEQPRSSYSLLFFIGLSVAIIVGFRYWKQKRKQYWYTEDRGESANPRYRIHYVDKTYEDSEFYRKF